MTAISTSAKLLFLLSLAMVAVAPANAQQFPDYDPFVTSRYTWTPVDSADVELKILSSFVPYEVFVRDTERAYLIACAIYDAAENKLGETVDFAEHNQTRFFFERAQEGAPPVAAKCLRSEVIFRARLK